MLVVANFPPETILILCIYLITNQHSWFVYRKEVVYRDTLCEKVAVYSQLGQTLDCIDKVDTSDGLRTQINLGSNFYAQAHM